MIQVKRKSEAAADSCSACYENKGTFEIQMGLEEKMTGRFRGGSICIRLCQRCIDEISAAITTENVGGGLEGYGHKRE